MNYYKILITGFIFYPLVGGNAQVRPNIVLINIDDLGWADLSFNGSKYYETPNIDTLKSRGLYFPNAYACAANSGPSRACLMTGEYSPRHGIYTVSPPDRGEITERMLIPCENAETLPNNKITLPLFLKKNGYQTCLIGKWHLGVDPTLQGFDINIGGNKSGHPTSYFSPYTNKNLQDGTKGEYLTDRLGNEAVNFIRSRDKNKNFFLYYAPYAVHAPLQAVKTINDKYKIKPRTEAHNNPAYAAMIESMDKTIGNLMKAISDNGIENQTIIIFTSDNGGVYNTSKQWPLRAGKGSFYEGGIRIPLIVVYPGVIQKNISSDAIVSQIDLFPTLAEIANAKVPDSMIIDGISLKDLILKNKNNTKNRSLYWHFPAYLEQGNNETKDVLFRSRPVSVIRRGDWKLIQNLETNEFELYNLRNDIAEKYNVASKFKGKVKELKKCLAAWKRKVNACEPNQPNPNYKK